MKCCRLEVFHFCDLHAVYRLARYTDCLDSRGWCLNHLKCNSAYQKVSGFHMTPFLSTFLNKSHNVSIWYFTSTLVVTSHEINACSVFALWVNLCAVHVSMASRLHDQLNKERTEVTSLPKCWWNSE